MTMSAFCEIVVAERALEQAHALVHVFLRQAALRYRRRVVLAHDAQAFVERFLLVSRTFTGMPALAKFIAMPPPMVPAPISAADLISCVGVSSGTSGILLTCRSAKNRWRSAFDSLVARSFSNSSRSRCTPLANGSVTAASTQSTMVSGAG